MAEETDLAPVLLDERQFAPERSPLLTLAIPAYRHAQFIEECLSGLVALEQRSLLEIVVLDDASPDETVLIAQECLQRLGISFRLYRRPQNSGLTAGLKFLLNEARGSFVLFCASDDRIRPESLDVVSHQIASSEFDQHAFVIFGANYVGDRDGPVYDKDLLEKVTSSAAALHKWVSEDFPRPLLLQSTVFRTAFLRQVDPWRQRLLLDDWPTFILASERAAAEQLPIRFDPSTTLVDYRVHAGGLHAAAERQIRACLETVETVVPRHFRRPARSNVSAHATISYLSEGRLLSALRSYVESVIASPSPHSLFKAPRLILKALLQRVWS